MTHFQFKCPTHIYNTQSAEFTLVLSREWFVFKRVFFLRKTDQNSGLLVSTCTEMPRYKRFQNLAPWVQEHPSIAIRQSF